MTSNVFYTHTPPLLRSVWSVLLLHHVLCPHCALASFCLSKSSGCCHDAKLRALHILHVKCQFLGPLWPLRSHPSTFLRDHCLPTKSQKSSSSICPCLPLCIWSHLFQFCPPWTRQHGNKRCPLLTAAVTSRVTHRTPPNFHPSWRADAPQKSHLQWILLEGRTSWLIAL